MHFPPSKHKYKQKTRCPYRFLIIMSVATDCCLQLQQHRYLPTPINAEYMALLSNGS